MRKWNRLVAFLVCALICAGVLRGEAIALADNSSFVIHFIDVGQADAAVVLCDDQVMMIDGGNAADSSLIYYYLTKTLGVEYIDYMVATHPHEDHIGGLAGALNACTVGTIYSPVQDDDSEAFRSFKEYADRQGVQLTRPAVGDTFLLGSAEVQVLSPTKDYNNVNDLSIVVRIVYGETSFLFSGDAEWDAEHDMIDSGLKLSSTLLKVGHHGSDTSISYIFLREIMPQYAVISVGESNSYGHPTDAVLSRLRDAGTEVYRTDLQGHIVCSSDGEILTFSTEKQVSDSKSLYRAAGASLAVSSLVPVDEVSTEVIYIGNKNTKKFHYPDCSSVDDMKDKNKVELYSREEAISDGYVPCKRCNP